MEILFINNKEVNYKGIQDIEIVGKSVIIYSCEIRINYLHYDHMVLDYIDVYDIV